MKVSLIIAVYKDVKALSLIIETLKYQTYKNFEAVVVEDGQSTEMKDYIGDIKNSVDFVLKHTTQDDLGVRKARSQNNGILASDGEYIVLIDGDCLLYSTFIEGHVKLSKKGYALSGRRLNLNDDLTQKLRKDKVTPLEIEKNLLTKYLYLAFDRNARFEQGIHLKPNGWIYNTFITQRDRNTSILGCNFSCWKNDMVSINGFDEQSYGETAIPDDMDFDWRFKSYGLKIKSCKNIANMMHLSHEIHDRGDATPYLKIMHEKKEAGKYICEHGLNTHNE